MDFGVAKRNQFRCFPLSSPLPSQYLFLFLIFFFASVPSMTSSSFFSFLVFLVLVLPSRLVSAFVSFGYLIDGIRDLRPPPSSSSPNPSIHLFLVSIAHEEWIRLVIHMKQSFLVGSALRPLLQMVSLVHVYITFLQAPTYATDSHRQAYDYMQWFQLPTYYY